MRLRLSIERHELPVVKILWHVPEQSTTISKLLEQISSAVPLESEGWGFEDYVVQVNGYECLHYLDVHNILNEDDEVSVRALQTHDIRARTFSGRHQISADGARLIDGIPFGRNYLKHPKRPQVQIPPRKRQRTAYDYPGAEEEHKYDHLDAQHDSTSNSDTLPATGMLRSGKKRARISFDTKEDDVESNGSDVDTESEASSESSDASENEGTKVLRITSGIEANSDGNTESDSEGGSDAESDNEIGIDAKSDSEAGGDDYSSDSSSVVSSSDADEGISGSTSDSGSEVSSFSMESMEVDQDQGKSATDHDGSNSDHNKVSGGVKSTSRRNDLIPAAQEEETVTGQPYLEKEPQLSASHSSEVPKRSRPGQGVVTTKSRNRRRKINKKLKKLRELADTEWSPEFAKKHTGKDMSQEEFNSFIQCQKQTVLDSLDHQDVEDVQSRAQPSNRKDADDVLPPEERKTLEKEQSDPVEIKVNITRPTAARPLLVTPMDYLNAGRKDMAKLESQVPNERGTETKLRRSKIDVEGSRRLLFGSLGIRAPKSKEDEDRLRARLSAEAARNAPKAGKVKPKNTHIKFCQETGEAIIVDPKVPDVNTVEALKGSGQDTDFEAWKTKLNITVVDCIDSEAKHTAPPFPFVQGWDPRPNHQNPSGKKRKRRTRRHADDWQGEEQDLNYDEEVDSTIDPNYQADTKVAAEGDQSFSPYDQDDLPTIPKDIDALPDLQFSNAIAGTVIVFRELEMSKATQWSPTVSAPRTAIIDAVSKDNQELMITLAKRDRLVPEEPVYDEDGKRVWGRWETILDLEEVDDDGKREIPFKDLIEPKVVRAAPAQVEGSPPSSHTLEGDRSGSNSSDILMIQDSATIGTLVGQALNELEGNEKDDEVLQDSMFTNENVSGGAEEGISGGTEGNVDEGTAEQVGGGADELVTMTAETGAQVEM